MPSRDSRLVVYPKHLKPVRSKRTTRHSSVPYGQDCTTTSTVSRVTNQARSGRRTTTSQSRPTPAGLLCRLLLQLPIELRQTIYLTVLEAHIDATRSITDTSHSSRGIWARELLRRDAFDSLVTLFGLERTSRDTLRWPLAQYRTKLEQEEGTLVAERQLQQESHHCRHTKREIRILEAQTRTLDDLKGQVQRLFSDLDSEHEHAWSQLSYQIPTDTGEVLRRCMLH